ncbi:hypothetical protein HMPREF0972_01778 [Actinomyces sp. oral taxon 848 str. F0332]|nr:hypothetical protein HMPREF0972_01778 [Actinomyces sp. oral taxon 848 str. F0332]
MFLRGFRGLQPLAGGARFTPTPSPRATRERSYCGASSKA